jgi:heme exporter protein B
MSRDQAAPSGLSGEARCDPAPAPTAAPMLKGALAVAAKDLRSEARAKQVAPLMITFALSLVLLFTFTLPSAGPILAAVPAAGTVAVREIMGTLLWTSLLLACVIGFGRSAAIETEANLVEGLLMAPIDPAAVFTAKAGSNFIFLTATEMLMFPALALFGNLGFGTLRPEIIMVALLANLGMAAVGTLLGAASQLSTARSLILALLTFPVLLPVILGASKLTSTLFVQGNVAGQGHWFILIGVFDVIFLTLGAVTFEFVIGE